MEPQGQDAADIAAEARLWLLRLREGAGQAERQAFDDWLRRPGRAEAYVSAQAVWDLSGDMAGRAALAEAEVLGAYLRQMEAPVKKRRLRTGLLILCGLGLAGGLWLQRPHLLQDLRADVVTQRAERREIVLPDGSRVTLDADSAIIEDFGPARRHVRLLRGAAFFEVTHSAVPFRVSAKETTVTVLGTLFDLRIDALGETVTLERGSVEVSGAAGAEPRVMHPGESLRVTDGVIGRPEPADLGAMQAWRGGWLVFHRARLDSVVERLAAYRPGRVVILSPRLAAETVTGSLSLKDPAAALRALSASLGFELHGADSLLTVIRP